MQTSLNFLIQRQILLDKKKMFGLRSKINSDVEYFYLSDYKMHYKQTRLHPLWNLRFEANTQGILLLSVSSSTFLNYKTANVPLWCRNIHISHCLLLLLCTLHYGGSFIQILIARMVEDCVSSFSFIDMWSSIGLFAFSDME